MTLTAKQLGLMSPDSKRNVAISYAPPLKGDEILVGIATVTQVSGSGSLTITDAQINDEPTEVLGKTVDAFHAVLFDVETEQTSAGRYVVNVVVASNNGQRFNDNYELEVPQ